MRYSKIDRNEDLQYRQFKSWIILALLQFKELLMEFIVAMATKLQTEQSGRQTRKHWSGSE